MEHSLGLSVRMFALEPLCAFRKDFPASAVTEPFSVSWDGSIPRHPFRVLWRPGWTTPLQPGSFVGRLG
jgi:hypothetical protein